MTMSAGAVFVGEVPDADVTGLDPDNDIGTTQGLHVRGGFLLAQVPGRDSQRGLGHALFDEARRPPDLDRAQRRIGLGHHDGRSRVTPQVPGLDVLLLDPDVEAAIAPLVPHGESRTVPSVRRVASTATTGRSSR